MVAALVFDAALSVPLDQRTKEIHLVCTDTRVEIPAVLEAVETTLAIMRKCAAENDLKLEVHLLRPPAEQSSWVNIIGRGLPPPNRTFRWCTQRLKIDPVTRFVERRMGRWSEAILHLGARRAESAIRAQTLAGRETRNGLTHRPTPARPRRESEPSAPERRRSTKNAIGFRKPCSPSASGDGPAGCRQAGCGFRSQAHPCKVQIPNPATGILARICTRWSVAAASLPARAPRPTLRQRLQWQPPILIEATTVAGAKAWTLKACESTTSTDTETR